MAGVIGFSAFPLPGEKGDLIAYSGNTGGSLGNPIFISKSAATDG